MMRPVENLQFNQRFRQRAWEPLARRINVFAKIRMMNETFAADFQFRSELAEVRLHNIAVRVHEGIETKDEID